MKNADKQGEPGLVRDGVSGHPGHIRHRMMSHQTKEYSETWHHRDPLAAVNTDKTNTFLMMRMSEKDQVQTTNRISQQFRQKRQIFKSYL